MTAQELIASGLLEAYVLGDGTPEERALVERMVTSDPNVKVELDAIERALEEHAFAGAVEPPVRSKAAVLKAIGASDVKVVPMVPVRGAPRMNWLAAASVVALLGSAVGNFFLYGELRNVRDRLANIDKEREVLAEQFQVQQVSLKHTEDQLAVVFDPNKHIVPLAGQAIQPKAAARVFMDPATHEVFIDVLSLPKPPPGKQYQLWAQVDGKMVDAGMLDMADNGDQLQHMKVMPNATAFGVTLENEGGSPAPTLSALYLFGAVS